MFFNPSLQELVCLANVRAVSKMPNLGNVYIWESPNVMKKTDMHF